jgi:hypothetical protein
MGKKEGGKGGVRGPEGNGMSTTRTARSEALVVRETRSADADSHHVYYPVELDGESGFFAWLRRLAFGPTNRVHI